jgi:phospholipase C
MSMKRRDALKTIGAMGAAAGAARVLPGCGGGDDEPGETIVVMMMENRSYDHLLGARTLTGLNGGDGLTASMTNPDLDGNPVAPYAAPTTPDGVCVPDPPHGWSAWDVQSDGGTNQGFLVAHQNSHGGSRTALEAMQYLTREHVPASWGLADAYTACDRWFCSVRGPTWPNRMYWHSGQSAGLMVNEIPTQGFSWDSIYHRLDAKGIGWKYYYGSIPVLSLVETLDLDGRLFTFDQFLLDAAAGTLPPVVYIDPAFFENDDHPPAHPILGQQLIASVFVALANSPQWSKCTLLATYDENGGFFDHVPPPMTADDFAATGFGQLGFRVPTLVAGPYVKPGYISSVVYDHTSVLKHLENKFGLDPLTMRSTAANDLDDCFDLDRMAAGAFADPATIAPIEVDWDTIPDSCFGAGRVAGHPILEWAEANPAKVAKWDRRAHVGEYLRMIGDFLDKHGAGRIRPAPTRRLGR